MQGLTQQAIAAQLVGRVIQSFDGRETPHLISTETILRIGDSPDPLKRSVTTEEGGTRYLKSEHLQDLLKGETVPFPTRWGMKHLKLIPLE